MSLWYSEVVGLPVRPLCWFARTMMYPLAVVLVVASGVQGSEPVGSTSYRFPYARLLPDTIISIDQFCGGCFM